jgi:hypothetical protein
VAVQHEGRGAVPARGLLRRRKAAGGIGGGVQHLRPLRRTTPDRGCSHYLSNMDFMLLQVPKVAGNVHFAPGHGMQSAFSHVHDLVSFTASCHMCCSRSFANVSSCYAGASIQHLSSSEWHLLWRYAQRVNSWNNLHVSHAEYFPGAHSPLDGHTISVPMGSGMHQYFIKLVPTVYKALGQKGTAFSLRLSLYYYSRFPLQRHTHTSSASRSI